MSKTDRAEQMRANTARVLLSLSLLASAGCYISDPGPLAPSSSSNMADADASMPPGTTDMKAPDVADMGAVDMPTSLADMRPVDMPGEGDMPLSCMPQSDEEFCAARGSVCGATSGEDNCGEARDTDCGVCEDGSCVDGQCVDCPAPSCEEAADQCGVVTAACGATTTCLCDGTRLCAAGSCEKTELVPAVSLTSEHGFGADVAIHQDVVVVGAPGGGGGAHVFERANGAWSYAQELSPAGSGEFGARVEVDDRFLFVSAPGFDAPLADGQLAAEGGAVFAYLKKPTTGEWVLAERITPPAGMITAGMRFGTSMSSDGKTLLVGAVAADGTGRVFSFTTTSTSVTWIFERELVSPLAADARFGAAVAVDGDNAVIGAPFDGATAHGRVVTFQRSGIWGEKAILVQEDMEPDGFGSSVALDRDTLVVGGPAAENGKGRVSMFLLNDQLGKARESSAHTSNSGVQDQLGADVAVANDVLLVAAPGREVRGDEEAGFVLSFALDRSDRMWKPGETYKALPEQDQDRFGQSIDRDGNLVVVGVPGRDTPNGPNSGAIYLFDAP